MAHSRYFEVPMYNQDVETVPEITEDAETAPAVTERWKGAGADDGFGNLTWIRMFHGSVVTCTDEGTAKALVRWRSHMFTPPTAAAGWVELDLATYRTKMTTMRGFAPLPEEE